MASHDEAAIPAASIHDGEALNRGRHADTRPASSSPSLFLFLVVGFTLWRGNPGEPGKSRRSAF
ncbi:MULTISPECIES: hypothetical protein [unclassified Pseudomonas]|uniref:hypothetical protein n=1 Tax=unclassified Pseudomonas TaxID=196821 RepID=UPI0015AB788F|nr:MULTISPECIES: hypothetical protein [unclassified Pseudomonas]